MWGFFVGLLPCLKVASLLCIAADLKFSKSCWPYAVPILSGWNCTPQCSLDLWAMPIIVSLELWHNSNSVSSICLPFLKLLTCDVAAPALSHRTCLDKVGTIYKVGKCIHGKNYWIYGRSLIWGMLYYQKRRHKTKCELMVNMSSLYPVNIIDPAISSFQNEVANTQVNSLQVDSIFLFFTKGAFPSWGKCHDIEETGLSMLTGLYTDTSETCIQQ